LLAKARRLFGGRYGVRRIWTKELCIGGAQAKARHFYNFSLRIFRAYYELAPPIPIRRIGITALA